MKASFRTAAFAAALFSVAEALDSPLPDATQTVELAADGVSPRPTEPAVLRRPGRAGLRPELMKRQDGGDEVVLIGESNTCGYFDGDGDLSYTCPDDTGLCGFRTYANGNVGDVLCCYSSTCYSTMGCVNSIGYYSSSLCDEACRLDPNWLKCTEDDRPNCATVSFFDNVLDIYCAETQITSTAEVLTTASGEDELVFVETPLGSLQSMDEDETTTEAESTATEDASTTEDSTSTSTSEPTESSDNNDDDNGGGTPVGAIAGGTVGGVAAIALAGLAIFFVRRNSKKKAAAAAAASPGTMAGTMGGGSPGNTMAPTPMMAQGSPQTAVGYPPGYNPGSHQSYYDPKFTSPSPSHPQAGYQYSMVPGQQMQYSSSSPSVDPHQSVYSNISPTPGQGGVPYPPPGQQPGLVGQPWQPQGGVIYEAPNNQHDPSRASEMP